MITFIKALSTASGTWDAHESSFYLNHMAVPWTFRSPFMDLYYRIPTGHGDDLFGNNGFALGQNKKTTTLISFLTFSLMIHSYHICQ